MAEAVRRRSWMAAVAFLCTGVVLSGAYLAAPDPQAWTPEDGAILEAAFRRGEAVADLFPGWSPAESPVLLTKGKVNYLINFPAGASAPPGKPVEAGGLRVSRLERPEVPVVANGVVPVNGEPVVLLAGRRQLEGAVGGLMAEQSLLGGGEAELMKGLLRTEAGRRFTDEEYVGVILHEAFHLYQLPAIERWTDGLTGTFADGRLWGEVYTDPENNRLQDREAAHLLAAVQAADLATVRAEAAAFLAVRAERDAYWQGRLGAEAPAMREVERLYEWIEGLARYVQIMAQASGREELIAQIGEPVDPAATRERVYRIGAGQALVLDRLAPGWQAEAMEGVPLEELLRRAIDKD